MFSFTSPKQRYANQAIKAASSVSMPVNMFDEDTIAAHLRDCYSLKYTPEECALLMTLAVDDYTLPALNTKQIEKWCRGQKIDLQNPDFQKAIKRINSSVSDMNEEILDVMFGPNPKNIE